MNYFIGTAGWSIPRQHQELVAPAGTHLERYASRFNCAEINSCFYRPHKKSTYHKWATSVPETFRFSVKVPKKITHTLRLKNCAKDLEIFLDETSALGKNGK